MKPTERRERIVEHVRALGKVSVDDLAEKLQASCETIRRDLTVLAEQGRIRKVHGAAVLPEARVEGAFHVRMKEAASEKRLVGERAAALFHSGDAMFVDTGTTTLFFAEALARKSGMTVITNSILVAQTLARGQGTNTVFMLGGEYKDDAAENVGPLAIEQIARFSAHHAVLTVGAITPFGIMDFSLDEVGVARAMVERARTVTVIADGSKLEKEALFEVCPLSAVSRIVINQRPTGAVAKALALAGVEVVLA